jgi:hypothetical protein
MIANPIASTGSHEEPGNGRNQRFFIAAFAAVLEAAMRGNAGAALKCL